MNISRNRLYNTQNQYQNFNKYKPVLCICSAGLLRSPTMARVLQDEYGYNTRAAGIDEDFALIPVDRALVAWADEIVFAEQSHYDKFSKMFDVDMPYFKTKVLNLPDYYSYMDPALCARIRAKYKELLDNE